MIFHEFKTIDSEQVVKIRRCLLAITCFFLFVLFSASFLPSFLWNKFPLKTFYIVNDINHLFGIQWTSFKSSVKLYSVPVAVTAPYFLLIDFPLMLTFVLCTYFILRVEKISFELVGFHFFSKTDFTANSLKYLVQVGLTLLGSILFFVSISKYTKLLPFHYAPQVGMSRFSLHGLFIAPVTEELFFRGLLFSFFKIFINRLKLLILTSFLFGFTHFFSLPLLSILGPIFFGFCVGYLYLKTESLFWPIILHFLVNFACYSLFR